MGRLRIDRGILTQSNLKVFDGNWENDEFIIPESSIATTPAHPVTPEVPDNSIVVTPVTPVNPDAPDDPIAVTPPEPIV